MVGKFQATPRVKDHLDLVIHSFLQLEGVLDIISPNSSAFLMRKLRPKDGRAYAQSDAASWCLVNVGTQ